MRVAVVGPALASVPLAFATRRTTGVVMTERNGIEESETDEQRSSAARRRETPEKTADQGPIEPHGFADHDDDATDAGGVTETDAAAKADFPAEEKR